MPVLDQPHQIEGFKLIQACSRLSLEINTGMGSRIPTLKICKEYYHLRANRKIEALDQMLVAKEKLLARHPSFIWLILAELRNSRVFIVCDDCSWEGDEFTALKSDTDDSWVCPRCKRDESALIVTKIEEAVKALD